MGKYKELLDNYEILEQQCTRTKAELMECQYHYDELQKEYEEQKKEQEEIKSLHESARRLKHDMKNHMLVLAAYLNDMEIEEAKEYVSKVFDKLNQMYTYIETGNTILNYCINAKLQKANEKKIAFKVQVENLKFQRVESVDLSAILTNLLDNAIEGSMEVAEPLIEVIICKKRSYETILIKNRIQKSVLDTNPSLHSTKVEHPSEHGYGTDQVRVLVDKYDGMIDFYEEDNMFCVQVAICEE